MIMELKTRENFKSDYFSWSLHDRDIRMEGKQNLYDLNQLEEILFTHRNKQDSTPFLSVDR